MKSPAYETKLVGDHVLIHFAGSPISLDMAVKWLNEHWEISCLIDAAPELNMVNYDESQVSDLNSAMKNIHKVVYGEKS